MQKMTKAQRVLEFIKASHIHGRSLKEIQCFILDMNGRQKWLDKGYLQYNSKTGELERAHAGRGYWCDYLYGGGGMYSREPGLLRRFCTQLPDGRWMVTEKIEGPWRRMPKPTKSWIANSDRKRGAEQRRIESLPRCPNCDQPIYKHSVVAADGKACVGYMTSVFRIDCKGRVWRNSDPHSYWPDSQLTTLSRSDVEAAEIMSREIHSNYADQREALWREMGKWLVN